MKLPWGLLNLLKRGRDVIHVTRITREDYTLLTGLVPDPWALGAVHYKDEQLVAEYIFAGQAEPIPTNVLRARQQARWEFEEMCHVPCVPACEYEQIAELERLLKLGGK